MLEVPGVTKTLISGTLFVDLSEKRLKSEWS